MSFEDAVRWVRAFAAIAQDLAEAGYSETEAATMHEDVEFYGEIRSAIKKHSGEELDIKPYEADMRHLLPLLAAFAALAGVNGGRCPAVRPLSSARRAAAGATAGTRAWIHAP